MIKDVTTDFKSYHFSIVDQIEDEEEAKAEQESRPSMNLRL